MHPWIIQQLAEQHVAELRGSHAARSSWLHWPSAGMERLSTWVGWRLIGVGCRLARPGVLAAARHGG